MRKKRNRSKLIWIIIGTILITQPTLIAWTYTDRGYFAVGGEWFLYPMLYLLYLVVRSFKEFVVECKKNI